MATTQPPPPAFGGLATAPPVDGALAARPVGARWARPLRRVPGASLVGFFALGVVLLLAIIGPWIAPYNPVLPDTNAVTAAPSRAHWLGTDQYGRDVLSRVLYAARLDLTVAISITVLALIAGALLGGVAGYIGSVVDDVVMRFVDVLLSFPSFILALGMTAMLGNTTRNVVIAVAVAYTPYFVRLVRGEMLSLREAEYAAAAKCVGISKARIMLYHLLPNAMTPALVQATLTLGWGILDVAGLSFLGVGIKPPTAEWGVLISDGAQYINTGQWWISVFPGIAILIAVLGFNLTGDWVRDSVLKQ